MEQKEKRITGYKVLCNNCGYEWVFTKGIPKYWIHCPKCKSRKNTLNHELFGKWHPDGDKR